MRGCMAEIPSAEFTAVVYDCRCFQEAATIGAKKLAPPRPLASKNYEMVDGRSVATPTNTHIR